MNTTSTHTTAPQAEATTEGPAPDVLDLTDAPGTSSEQNVETGTPTEPEAESDRDGDKPLEDTRPGREAARYRARLRETEAERDALRGRLEAMQRAEAERLAGDELKVPAGLWKGATLTDLLDDEGNLDADKVHATVSQVKAELGLAGPRDHLLRGNRAPREGTVPEARRRRSWSDAFAPSRDE